MVYETLLVAALVLILGVIIVVPILGLQDPSASSSRLPPTGRNALFVVLLISTAAYFLYFWTRGQTLAMRAWRLRLVDASGHRLDWRRAALRTVAAGVPIGLAQFGALALLANRPVWLAGVLALPALICLAWAVMDTNRQCLYDRIAGTRLVVMPRG